MTDFSPHAVKVAARRAVEWFKAGDTDKFSERSTGEHETTSFGCIVRILLDGRGGVIVRVIDANGRHWFPDVEAAAPFSLSDVLA